MRARLATVVAALGSLAGSGAAAQRDSASVAGVITERRGGAPVRSASVMVMGGRVRALTDSAGRFQLTGLAAGTHVVRVQRVGFAPLEFELDLAAGEAATIPAGTLTLEAAAVAVESVVVAADAGRIPALAAQGFYERRSLVPGAFLERAEFTEWNPAALTDVLRRTSGVSIVANPNYQRWAQPPRRGVFGARSDPPKMAVDTRRYLIKVRGCEDIVLWLDGMLIGTPQDLDVDQMVNLVEIEAIEVYRGPSEIPARFSSTRAACGVIAIWTRVSPFGAP